MNILNKTIGEAIHRIVLCTFVLFCTFACGDNEKAKNKVELRPIESGKDEKVVTTTTEKTDKKGTKKTKKTKKTIKDGKVVEATVTVQTENPKTGEKSTISKTITEQPSLLHSEGTHTIKVEAHPSDSDKKVVKISHGESEKKITVPTHASVEHKKEEKEIHVKEDKNGATVTKVHCDRTGRHKITKIEGMSNIQTPITVHKAEDEKTSHKIVIQPSTSDTSKVEVKITNPQGTTKTIGVEKDKEARVVHNKEEGKLHITQAQPNGTLLTTTHDDKDGKKTAVTVANIVNATSTIPVHQDGDHKIVIDPTKGQVKITNHQGETKTIGVKKDKNTRVTHEKADGKEGMIHIQETKPNGSLVVTSHCDTTGNKKTVTVAKIGEGITSLHKEGDHKIEVKSTGTSTATLQITNPSTGVTKEMDISKEAEVKHDKANPETGKEGMIHITEPKTNGALLTTTHEDKGGKKIATTLEKIGDGTTVLHNEGDHKIEVKSSSDKSKATVEITHPETGVKKTMKFPKKVVIVHEKEDLEKGTKGMLHVKETKPNEAVVVASHDDKTGKKKIITVEKIGNGTTTLHKDDGKNHTIEVKSISADKAKVEITKDDKKTIVEVDKKAQVVHKVEDPSNGQKGEIKVVTTKVITPRIVKIETKTLDDKTGTLKLKETQTDDKKNNKTTIATAKYEKKPNGTVAEAATKTVTTPLKVTSDIVSATSNMVKDVVAAVTAPITAGKETMKQKLQRMFKKKANPTDSHKSVMDRLQEQIKGIDATMGSVPPHLSQTEKEQLAQSLDELVRSARDLKHDLGRYYPVKEGMRGVSPRYDEMPNHIHESSIHKYRLGNHIEHYDNHMQKNMHPDEHHLNKQLHDLKKSLNHLASMTKHRELRGMHFKHVMKQYNHVLDHIRLIVNIIAKHKSRQVAFSLMNHEKPLLEHDAEHFEHKRRAYPIYVPIKHFLPSPRCCRGNMNRYTHEIEDINKKLKGFNMHANNFYKQAHEHELRNYGAKGIIEREFKKFEAEIKKLMEEYKNEVDHHFRKHHVRLMNAGSEASIKANEVAFTTRIHNKLRKFMKELTSKELIQNNKRLFDEYKEKANKLVQKTTTRAKVYAKKTKVKMRIKEQNVQGRPGSYTYDGKAPNYHINKLKENHPEMMAVLRDAINDRHYHDLKAFHDRINDQRYAHHDNIMSEMDKFKRRKYEDMGESSRHNHINMHHHNMDDHYNDHLDRLKTIYKDAVQPYINNKRARNHFEQMYDHAKREAGDIKDAIRGHMNAVKHAKCKPCEPCEPCELYEHEGYDAEHEHRDSLAHDSIEHEMHEDHEGDETYAENEEEEEEV